MTNRRLAQLNRHRYCFLLAAHTTIISYISALSSSNFNISGFFRWRPTFAGDHLSLTGLRGLNLAGLAKTAGREAIPPSVHICTPTPSPTERLGGFNWVAAYLPLYYIYRQNQGVNFSVCDIFFIIAVSPLTVRVYVAAGGGRFWQKKNVMVQTCAAPNAA